MSRVITARDSRRADAVVSRPRLVVVSAIGVAQILAWGSSYYLPASSPSLSPSTPAGHSLGWWAPCPLACSSQASYRRGSVTSLKGMAAARCWPRAPSCSRSACLWQGPRRSCRSSSPPGLSSGSAWALAFTTPPSPRSGGSMVRRRAPGLHHPIRNGQRHPLHRVQQLPP